MNPTPNIKKEFMDIFINYMRVKMDLFEKDNLIINRELVEEILKELQLI